jgi:hypothetical protein
VWPSVFHVTFVTAANTHIYIVLFSVYINIYIEITAYKYIYMLPFQYIVEMETAKFRLFAANRNGKRTFVFLGQRMIIGNP